MMPKVSHHRPLPDHLRIQRYRDVKFSSRSFLIFFFSFFTFLCSLTTFFPCSSTSGLNITFKHLVYNKDEL